jgi:hypothetical protein
VSWQEQVERERKLLALDRAGGLWQGTGMGTAVSITHTTGKEGEGLYASYVVLTLENNDGQKVSVPIPADYAGVMDSIIGSLKYHTEEARRLTRERQH